MATSTIKKGIVYVEANGSGTITSANGFVNVVVNFTAPSGAEYLGTVVRTVSASQSTNDVRTFIPITDSSTSTTYRLTSASAQTLTVTSRKYYLI